MFCGIEDASGMKWLRDVNCEAASRGFHAGPGAAAQGEGEPRNGQYRTAPKAQPKRRRWRPAAKAKAWGRVSSELLKWQVPLPARHK